MTKPWRNITTIWSDKKNCVFVFISVNLTGYSSADNGDLINTDGEQLLEPTESELIVAKWDSQRENYLIW